MLKELLKSNYCRAIFVISVIVSYFLLPDFIFMGWLSLLAVLFMLIFSVSMTCMVRGIKDTLANTKKTSTSVLSLISMLFGFSAFHACTIGAPLCVTAGLGLLVVALPGFMVDVLSTYGVIIIVVSMVIQILVLYWMGCLRYK